MQNTVEYADVEGKLVEVAKGGQSHLAKRLSTAMAWQVFDVQDLTNVADAVVTSVTTDLGAGYFDLHYRPGIEIFRGLRLRDDLRLESELGPWLAAGLAHDLARSLKSLHIEDVPQLVLHPERVGRIAGQFVLLPTVAGILPPLSQLRSNEVGGWLHYVAPETLRTRATDKSLLLSGDVYSWGRMLWLLCAPSWRPDLTANPQRLAEQRVEQADRESLPPLPAGFKSLADIWSRAMALGPSHRPSLDELLTQLAKVRDDLAPELRFAQLLREGKVAAAEQLAGELEQVHRAGIRAVPERVLHLMAADLHLARSPPDPGRAIMELDLAESPERYEADVQERLARAYRQFTANPQHLSQSSKAYERAANFGGWKPEVLDEWVGVLQQMGDFEHAQAMLSRIPNVFHTRKVSVLLIECLLRKQEYLEAWREVAALFPGQPFDEGLFELARTIAERNDPGELLVWSLVFRNEPGFDAPLSLVFEAIGDEAQAETYLRQARAYQPGTGD